MKRPHALWWAAPLAVGLCERGPAASRATHPSDHRTDRSHTGERLLVSERLGVVERVRATGLEAGGLAPPAGRPPRRLLRRLRRLG
jgi:hypothetical protein